MARSGLAPVPVSIDSLPRQGSLRITPRQMACRTTPSLESWRTMPPLVMGGGTSGLSTLGGLSRFDPQSGTFRNYDASDGLQGDIFNPAACQNQLGARCYSVVSSGLTSFYPEDVQENPNIPPVRVTGFSLSNEPVSIGGRFPSPAIDQSRRKSWN